MAETATEAGPRSDTIDQAIEQVENLYRSVTGHEAPPVGDRPYAGIPPERAPEQHVEEQIDRLLDALSQFTGASTTQSWTPPISIWESSSEILIRLDLPGVPRQAIKVTTARNVLEISGRRTPRSQEESNPHQPRYVESRHGEFRRVIPVPRDVDVERLQAQMRDGVLEIKLPRIVKLSEAKSVPVG